MFFAVKYFLATLTLSFSGISVWLWQGFNDVRMGWVAALATVLIAAVFWSGVFYGETKERLKQNEELRKDWDEFLNNNPQLKSDFKAINARIGDLDDKIARLTPRRVKPYAPNS